MKIYDISMRLSEDMLRWTGAPPPEFSLHRSFEQGHTSRSSIWSISMHAGTHIDAPAHIIWGGFNVDAYALEPFIGWVTVVDLTHVQGEIQASHLRAVLPPNASRVLLKTSNSVLQQTPNFSTDYVALSPEGATFLVEQKVVLVGIDYLGIEPYTNLPHCPTHEILLKAGIPIVEGLALVDIQPGNYVLCCLPLKIDAEASITRAVLIDSLDELNLHL